MISQRIGLTGRRLQYFAFCAGGLNMVSCGLHLAWTAPYLPQLLDLTSPIPITHNEGSWMAVSLLIGAIFGSSSAAAFLDRLGRKKLIVASTVPLLTSWLMIAYATTVWELCVARFIAGLSQGVSFCTLPLYFAEMSDANIRGVFGAGVTVICLFGVMLGNVIGTILSIREMALVGAVLPVVVFLTMAILPETSHFHLLHGEIDMAQKSLEAFSGKSDVKERLDTIMRSVTQETHKGKWVQLFKNKKCRRTLLIMLVLRGMQAWAGTIAFTFYLPDIFKESGEFMSVSTSIVLYYTIQTVSTILLMTTVDKIGRKALLMLSVILTIAALSSVGVYFIIRNLTNIEVTHLAWIPFVGMMLFIFGSSVGITGIPLLLIGELFPMGVKSLAVPILDVQYNLMSAIASKYFQYTKDEFGLHVPILTFALVCTCGIPVIVFCVSETKQKSLEEIESGANNQPV